MIIGRPVQENGAVCGESVKASWQRNLASTLKPHITLLGIGMGSEETLTIQGKKAAENADLIIGAKRLADAVRQAGTACVL